jgi:hypothetical protein
VGVENFQGQNFAHYEATELSKGVLLSLNLAGLLAPGPMDWLVSGFSNLSGLNLGLAVLVMGSFVLVMVGGAVLLANRRRQRLALAAAVPQPGGGEASIVSLDPANNNESEESLLLDMAELDDQFEVGTISEQDYQQRRAEKKAQLMELLSRRPRRRDTSL